MISPHPASSILLGLGVLLAASSRAELTLLLCCFCLALAALAVATAHLRLLLLRSRWLLLTLLILFGWLTPGTPLQWVPGATQEGLLLAAENAARLLIALSVVALLLHALSSAQLVAGMRSLLAPLALLGIPRDRIAVRLALTLNEVEAARNGTSGERPGMRESLTLPASAFGGVDLLLGLLAIGLMLGAWLT